MIRPVMGVTVILFKTQYKDDIYKASYDRLKLKNHSGHPLTLKKLN
jgi:hypothetical protein